MAFPNAADIVNNPSELRELFGLTPAVIGDVVVDVVQVYTDPTDVDVTYHPVEAGYDISDSRTVRPQYLSMDIILTDPDFSGTNIGRSIISGTFDYNINNSWRDKRDRLRELVASDELITVTTSEDLFSNMTITSLRPERNAQTANAYFCTVELQEIIVVASEIGEAILPESLRKKEPKPKDKPKPKDDKGTQQPQQTKEEKRKSLGKQIFKDRKVPDVFG